MEKALVELLNKQFGAGMMGIQYNRMDVDQAWTFHVSQPTSNADQT